MRIIKEAFASGIFMFLIGLVAGLLLYGNFCVNSLQEYKELIRSDLALEEEYRARRAERKGRLENAIFHQKNTVVFSAPNNIKAFSRKYDEGLSVLIKPIWYFMFINYRKLLVVDLVDDTFEKDESFKRGYLAYLLEKSGQFALADIEWQLAANLDGVDVGQKKLAIKNYVEKTEWTSNYLKVEESILGAE